MEEQEDRSGYIAAMDLAATEPPNVKNYRVITERMTRAEVAASRRPGLRGRKCLIQSEDCLPDIRFISENESEWVKIEVEAKVYVVFDALKVYPGPSRIFCLLDEEILATEPLNRKFVFEQYANPTTVEMLKAAPTNPIALGMIRREFRRKPPAELTTYEQIKDWVEFHGEKPATVAPRSPSTIPGTGITLPYYATILERGSCRFSTVGRRNFNRIVSENEFQDIIAGSDDENEVLERFREMIDGNIQEEAGELDYDPNAYTQFDTDEVQVQDCGIRGSSEPVLQAIRDKIIQQYGEDAERMGLL